MIISHARDAGVSLLALPDGALGGYLTDLRGPDEDDLPPLLEPNGDEVRSVIDFAGDMVVCLGYSERGLDEGNGLVRYDAAVCLSGDGILGRHRKVHLPAGIAPLFAAGDGFRAFDTPVGRMGLLIDHDKTFPEAARALAVDGAEILACLSAWPTSLTNRAPRMAQDRQARLFDLYDQARAAENQVVLAVVEPERALRRAALPGPGEGRRAGWGDPRAHVVEGRAGGGGGRPPGAGRGGPDGAAPPRRASSRDLRLIVRIALLTYSTKPRGGVVHTLALAEAFARAGHAGDGVGAGAGRGHGLLPSRRRRGDRPAGARRGGRGRDGRGADPAVDRAAGVGVRGIVRRGARAGLPDGERGGSRAGIRATCGGPCTTSTSSRRPSSPPATSGRWWSRRRWCACRRRWRARSGRAGAGRPR